MSFVNYVRQFVHWMPAHYGDYQVFCMVISKYSEFLSILLDDSEEERQLDLISLASEILWYLTAFHVNHPYTWVDMGIRQDFSYPAALHNTKELLQIVVDYDRGILTWADYINQSMATSQKILSHVLHKTDILEDHIISVCRERNPGLPLGG